MARFYGSVKGNRGEASRLGNKGSGMITVAAGWDGAIRVILYEEDGKDRFTVYLTPHMNSGGQARIIASGELKAMENRDET